MGASAATLPELLAYRAKVEPDRAAVRVFGGDQLDFGHWHASARAVAAQLDGLGVRRGDRVALCFTSSAWAEYVESFMGVLSAGGVAVPLPERGAPAELAYILGHSEAVGVLAGPGTEIPTGTWWVRRPERSAPPAAQPGDRPAPEPSDPAQLLYTSGTTGSPKAVLADHANLAHATTMDARRRPLKHCETFLHAFAIGTNAGQTMLVNALNAHATALVAPHFTPRSFLRIIEANRVGAVFLVPAMANELITAGTAARFDLSGVGLVGSTAAPLPPSVAIGLATLFPTAVIINTYTSTEAAPAYTAMVVDPHHPGALGRPVDGAVRILTESGALARPGQVGAVWLRSPTSPRSYYRDPTGEGTAAFRGRWIRMGDLGYFDDDGYLFLVDRESDVIKTGAFKVSTVQVENALRGHHTVADAAVFGVSHPTLGTAPAAAVVADGVTAEELRAYLRPLVAPYAVPSRVIFLPELPRNTAGKILKRQLRETLTRSADPAGRQANRIEEQE